MGTAIETVIPSPDFTSTDICVVAGPPESAWMQLHLVALRELPQTRLLSAIRYLPRQLVRKTPAVSSSTLYLDHLPIPPRSATPGVSQLSAGLSQAWRLLGGEPAPQLTLEELSTWTTPGWIKVAMEFRFEPVSSGTLVTTETRIVATDDHTRRVFGAYWRLIEAASASIRREVVGAVARRAAAQNTPPLS